MKVDRSQFMEEESFEITSLIDIVFLLLIYFMVTATILQEESDLSISLPAPPPPGATPPPPAEELIIDIQANGQILVNSEPVDDIASRDLPELRRTLTRAKQLAELTGGRAMVVIQANEDSVHQRTIDVLNAAASARIRFVTFGSP